MSGQNVIPLDPSRRVVRRTFPEEGIIAMLIFLIFDAMIVAGMVGTFFLVRATSGDVWPPSDHPWFPVEQTAINSIALAASGGLVFLAARAWEQREGRIRLLLTAAIALGVFFLFFQAIQWINLFRSGTPIASSQHGGLFCLVVATHAIQAIGGLAFLAYCWLRLKPIVPDGDVRGRLSDGVFTAARYFWYFVVGAWPALYVCLYN